MRSWQWAPEGGCRWWWTLLAAWLAGAAWAQLPGVPSLTGGASTHVRWDVLLDPPRLVPGGTNLLALRMRIDPGWHTYWRQPSDSGDIGQAPAVQWTLPAGVTVGEFAWPTPESKYDPSLRDTTYLYHGTAWLLAPVRVDAGVPLGAAILRGEIKWQECDADQCLPRRTQVEARLDVGVGMPGSPEVQAGFRDALARLPRPVDFPVQLRWLDPPSSDARRFRVEFAGAPGSWDFYPFANPAITLGDSDPSLRQDLGGRTSVTKRAIRTGTEWPTGIQGLVVRSEAGGKALESWEVVAVEGGTEAASPRGASPTPDASAGTFWAMLGAAFLGGLILNIMPCVLPVIALKVLGFVRQSQESPARVRVLGLAYGGGVLLSFLGLASMILLAQAIRGWASWGMQFQDARFLVLMTALIVLVSLNLLGVFEVHLGGRTMTAASGLAQREGVGGAVANGVLATVLATPCTAPFLAPALGYAIPQKSPAIILLFFLTIGLGLAFPYVVLCWNPRWLRLLPKPGAWMEKFKMAMAFPMLATAVWLFSLSVGFYGEDGVLWLGLFLVLLALAAWIFGEFVQRGQRRRGLAWVASGLVLATAYGVVLEGRLEWRTPAPPAASDRPAADRRPGGHLPWEKWSPEAVAAARAAGRAVLVDFTAKTCLVCQLNKKVAIEVPAVLDKIRTNQVAVLKADFTMEDPAILAELQRFGRAGVPLVLVYPRDKGAPPEVLPATLTKGLVLEALDRALR